MTSTPTTINNAPCRALWYTVVPAGAATPAYAGLDRAEALDRVVALLAQGEDVEAGERFRRDPSGAYVTVARVTHIGDSVVPVPDTTRENDLLAEARSALIKARTCLPNAVPPACEHGSPARRVLLTDKTRVRDGDPYGDIEGPEAIEHLASMERTLAAYSADTDDRYTLAFIHGDLCRTARR